MVIIILHLSSGCGGLSYKVGNDIGQINEVALRRARLVLGWVTVSGSTPGAINLSRYITNHPSQLSLAILPWVGKMSTDKGR